MIHYTISKRPNGNKSQRAKNEYKKCNLSHVPTCYFLGWIIYKKREIYRNYIENNILLYGVFISMLATYFYEIKHLISVYEFSSINF